MYNYLTFLPYIVDGFCCNGIMKLVALIICCNFIPAGSLAPVHAIGFNVGYSCSYDQPFFLFQLIASGAQESECVKVSCN
jgi:hypothetical protein